MSTHDRQSDVEWFAVPSLGCSCYFIYAQVPCNFTPANDLGPVGLPPGLCAAFTFHSVITLYALAALAACCCMPCCRLYHSLTIAAYYFRRIPKCACVWVECVRDVPSFSGLWSHVHACMWLPIRT